MDYAARSGSIREDWPPNFGYKKRAAGEFSRVLAQARTIPASRKWRNAEQSNKVQDRGSDIPSGYTGPEQVAPAHQGQSSATKYRPTMRAPC